MKNNLEEVLKEEFEEYYFESVNKPTRFVSKEYIVEKSYQYKNMLLSYIEARKKSQEKIEQLEQELQKTREQLENACSKLKYATNSLEFANSLMDEDEEDVQEMNEWISEARVFIEQRSKTNKENRE